MLIFPGEGEVCLLLEMELADKSLLSLMIEFLEISFADYPFEFDVIV